MGPREHVGQVQIQEAGFLKVCDRVTQLSMNIVHDVFYGKSPTYLKPFFKKVSDVHSYNTRSSGYGFYRGTHNFAGEKAKNTIDQKTFHFNTSKEWNSLPNHLKAISNKQTFKIRLKAYLKGRGYLSEPSQSVS